MRLTPELYRPALLWSALVLAVNSTSAAALDWKPVDPADLASTSPRVEKDADAEVIFWEVWVTDEGDVRPRSVFTQYIRMKIFTERGRDQIAKTRSRTMCVCRSNAMFRCS